jgi:hypothetical protein
MKKTKYITIFFFIITIFTSLLSINSHPAFGQSSTTKISFDPLEITAQAVNDEITVKLTITEVNNLWMWTTKITWDTTILSLVGNPVEETFLKQGGTTFFQHALAVPGETPDVTEMYLEISDSLMANTTVSGSGDLATLKFKILKPAIESPICINSTEILGPNTGTYDSPVNLPIVHQVQSPALVTLVPEGMIVANAGLPQSVDEGVPVTLNASKTLPKSNDLNFTWTFFDGEQKTLTGIFANYTFEIPGSYNITLAVKNTEGTESTAQTVITVNDITPPVAIITIDGDLSQAYVGEMVRFSGRDSYDPENGSLNEFGYLWSFGDASENDTHREIEHSYQATGTYTVTFSVRDLRGNLTGTDSITLLVKQNSNPSTTTEGEGTVQQLGSLPPIVLGVIVTVTIVTIVGSAFWLMGGKKVP